MSAAMGGSGTVLVTGATGFLGSCIVHRLLADGHSVVALRRSGSSLERLAAVIEQVTLVDIEQVAPAELFAAHPNINLVIHAATNYGRGGEVEAIVQAANVTFPLDILAAALAAGVTIFINTDTSLPATTSPYAASKKQFLALARERCHNRPIRLVNLLLEQVFGPGDGASKFTSYVIAGCQNNVAKLALTAGEQRRDFIYVDDAVDAYMQVIDANLSESFQEYPVGLGSTVTIREFVEMVKRVTGSTTQLDFGAVPYRDHEVMRSQADILPLGRLGWHPKIGLEEAIRLTTEQGGTS